MTMSSILCSQGVVLATAMAISGTVILLALRLQKSIPLSEFPILRIPPSTSQQVLPSCISSERKRKKKMRKKKKRVHFAEDVVDPRSDGEEFRRQQAAIFASKSSSSSHKNGSFESKERQMPANRVALYNGILRDRGVHRLAHSS
ncbi:hypothetical protein K2173_017682 [Erythroxylum novogranatense]|uniref:Uncharacterized protein n=1 Tax=Erythroxylum novogranatense TaxID=1862640 RepID=A0AAV8SLG5_9ROSI|nr:hypothetical protein K2173_017682 [Erythroxylum novogranatense]